MTERPRTSTRDIDAVVDMFAQWLQVKLGLDRPPAVTCLGGPSGAGFSSDTVLFDIVDGEYAGRYVLRLPPPTDAFPIFQTYDLARQVRAMRLVADRTAIPVPRVPWFEPDSKFLGSPFFVMDRLDGEAASDVPPYVFGGWLLDGSPHDRERAEAGVVRALVGIHDLKASADELAPMQFGGPGVSPLQRHVAHQRRYYDWIRGDARFSLIDSLFDWIDAHWPDSEGPAVLTWGDARVANVLFRSCEPVAILDWELAAVGPRELEL